MDELHGTMQQLLNETRKGNKTGKEYLSNGRIREEEVNGNVHVYRRIYM